MSTGPNKSNHVIHFLAFLSSMGTSFLKEAPLRCSRDAYMATGNSKYISCSLQTAIAVHFLFWPWEVLPWHSLWARAHTPTPGWATGTRYYHVLTLS